MKRQKELKQDIQRKVVASIIVNFKEKSNVAFTIKQVQRSASTVLGYRIGWETVRKMMKQNFKMRHEKVKRISFHGNTESCLVKRHLYARRMFELLDQGYHVFNIDESTLSVSNFARKMWVEKKGSKSVVDEVLKQKINLIVAVSNRGEAYIAQTIVNTDDEMMCMFFSKFSQVMT